MNDIADKTNMNLIDQKTMAFSVMREALAKLVDQLNGQIQQLKLAALPDIRKAVAEAKQAEDDLTASLEEHPHLFDKPRTRTLHGIKVGYTKQRGKVVIDDEEKVVANIEQKLPKAQAELLIRVRKTVDKNAVADLTVPDLKRLGIRITDDTDTVVIKPADSAVDKLVDALLADIVEPEEAA